MIYWFIGQPGCGKTTLARLLKEEMDNLHFPAIHLDGDDLRKIFGTYQPEHFTKEYRLEWTRKLQSLVAHLNSQGVSVIVSTVNPYKDVREEFKLMYPTDMKEIYVYTQTPRVRQEYWCKDFEEPMENKQTIWIDTTGKTTNQSFDELYPKLIRR